MGRRKRTTAELKWKRTQIIEGAARVFVNEGYHGATMGMIAGASGCSAATLYTYFANKEDLFEGVMEHLGKEMLSLVEAPSPPDMNVRQSLFWILQRMEEFASRNEQLLLTYLVQHDMKKHGVQDDEIKTAFIEYYASVFEEGVSRGEIREDISPVTLALAFDGMTHSLGTQKLMAGEPLGDALESMVDLFLNGASAPS